MNKFVLWKQVQMILDNLSVLINRVAAVVKTPTGKNQMLVTGGDGQSKWVDRTHWADVEQETLLPKTSLEYQSGPGQFVYTGELPAPTIGETYTISWNDVEYQCEANKLDMGGMSAVGFGNLGAIGAGAATDDPFSIIVLPSETAEAFGGYSLIAIPLDMLETLELAIFSEVTVVKKIDPKYLPDGIGGGEYTPPDWGSKHEDGYLMPETTLTVVPEAGAAAYAPVIDVAAGKQYTVKWNGTDYVCTAAEIDMQGLTVVALGNHGALTGGETTSEPFVVLVLTAEQAAMMGVGVMVMPLDGSMSPVVSIYGDMETVQKIEGKFLSFTGFPTIDIREYGITEKLAHGPKQTAQLTEEQAQEIDKVFKAGAFWCITGGFENVDDNPGSKALLNTGVAAHGNASYARAMINLSSNFAVFAEVSYGGDSKEISAGLVTLKP